MPRGSKVGLSARHEDDIPVLVGEFLDEVLLGLLVQDWKPDSGA
ncbi:hypothetical protein [Streptomyces sp. ISL-94]|nr:hypothetical protein [Streptomyces sp. ISL-94]